MATTNATILSSVPVHHHFVSVSGEEHCAAFCCIAFDARILAVLGTDAP